MEVKLDIMSVAEVPSEVVALISEMESENRVRMIDYALETNNEQLFHELMKGMQ